MCTGRYRDGGSGLAEWAEPEVVVACPRCGARAVVRRADPEVGDGGPRRLTCPACGLAKDRDAGTTSWGAAVDPWFGERLWLQAELRGHTVWAFNARHLDALRSYVAAGLRERTPQHGAAMSMLEKLPGWMTSAKNRDEVVATLDRLDERASA